MWYFGGTPLFSTEMLNLSLLCLLQHISIYLLIFLPFSTKMTIELIPHPINDTAVNLTSDKIGKKKLVSADLWRLSNHWYKMQNPMWKVTWWHLSCSEHCLHEAFTTKRKQNISAVWGAKIRLLFWNDLNDFPNTF